MYIHIKPHNMYVYTYQTAQYVCIHKQNYYQLTSFGMKLITAKL